MKFKHWYVVVETSSLNFIMRIMRPRIQIGSNYVLMFVHYMIYYWLSYLAIHGRNIDANYTNKICNAYFVVFVTIP